MKLKQKGFLANFDQSPFGSIPKDKKTKSKKHPAKKNTAPCKHRGGYR